LGGKLILTIKDRLLPNLIAGHRIVPEFVPHWGGPKPIASAVAAILGSEEEQQRQRNSIQEALRPYEGRDFATLASGAILESIEG
ncbi:MAG: hypothetical protein MK085_12435, partial [Phycisphaerales bacterium]|nr:hypothetical protein [Phycisphaerales bacterium]